MNNPLIVFAGQLIASWLFGFGVGSLFAIFKNFYRSITFNERD